MRRSVSLVVGLLAGVAVFSACREVTVAPHDVLTPVALNVPPVSFSELQGEPAGISFTVTLDPRRDNTYSDGINTVRFPAGSICDPATSGYGPGMWDAPCVSATAPITLPITLSIRGGRLHVEFGRDLRFAPSSDPAKHVVLTVSNPVVSYTSENLRRYAIFYVPTGTSSLLDESLADPSLVTIIKRSEGKVVRRLKHFTGYNLHLGIWTDCMPGIDDGCYAQPPEGTVKAQ
jgi:hypothetical protein